MSWEAVAEAAVRQRCAAILERMRAAVSEHAPDARISGDGDELRVRGRGLKQRWIAEPGLRFARRIVR